MAKVAPNDVPAGGTRAHRYRHPVDTARSELELAVRGLSLTTVAALGAVAVIALAMHRTDPAAGRAVALLAIAASATTLLIGRRAARWTRELARRAGRNAALPRQLLASADAFARSTAGVDGTIAELVGTAHDHGCEVVIWDDAHRTLRVPARGTAYRLSPAAAHALIDAMRQRRPIRFPDVTGIAGLPSSFTEVSGTRSALVAPMWVADTFLGIVLRRYTSPNELYRADEGDRVGALASLGSVALGKAMVVDSERQRSDDNATLLRAVERSVGEHVPELLGGYATEARQIAGASGAVLVRIAGPTGWLIAGAGLPREVPEQARSGPVDPQLSRWLNSLKGRAVLSSRVGLAPHISGLDALLGRAANRYLVQPVADGRGVLAVLVLSDPRSAGDREADLLAVIARQIGMVLERSDLTRVMQQRSQRLARAPQLARTIAGQRDPRAVARLATRELVDGFGYCRVSIALREAGDLRLVASAGVLARSPSPVGACPDVLRQAFVSGESQVMCGTGDGESGHDSNAPLGCRSQLVVPVTGADGEAIGVIAVYGRRDDALSEDDLHLLESVADHLSAVIQQARLYEDLETSYFKTVEALAAALEAKDAYTLDHSRSITEVAAHVGRRLGMADDELRDLRLGALLHDIGKIGIPTEILNKPGPLTPDERTIMERHTVIGEQIIAPVAFLDAVRPLVLHEHERWDGRGYPHRLAGHDIPLGARIIFVCDSWHAMTTDRPYRKALPAEEAVSRLREGAGTQFDPDVVEAFVGLVEAGPLPV